MVELRRTSATTTMGFIFLRSCFMDFIFFVVLVVGSSDFLRSLIHLGLSLRLDDLEQIQEEGRWWFRENGARSRPKWSSISDWPLSLLFGFSFFLFFFCFWVVGLIMIWLWWGYGSWLVDCGWGGGGAKLWVLIVVVVEWVAMLHGFQFFFFFWLWVSFDFGLLVVWKMRGIFGLDSKDLIGFGCVTENFELYLQMLCSWGKDSMVRVFYLCYVWFLIKLCFSNVWVWGR